MKVIRPRFDQPQPKLRLPTISARTLGLWTMGLLATVAVAVSGYLAWMTLTPDGEVGCGAGLSCEEVLSSRWSKWLGLPVAIPALSLYATLLVALVFSSSAAPKKVQELAWKVVCTLALIAAGAAAWFIALQSLVVGHYCPWCLTVHACGICLALVALAMSWKSLSTIVTAMAVSLGAVALLVAGQWFQPEASTQVAYEKVVNNTSAEPVRLGVEGANQTNAPPKATGAQGSLPSASKTSPGAEPDWIDDLVSEPPPVEKPPLEAVNSSPNGNELNDPPQPPSSIDDDLNAPEDPPVAEPPPQADPPPKTSQRQRIISLLDRKAELDVYQHPILGSPEATHVVVKLFDYTCPHCRVMHGHLQVARERFGSEFAILMLPVPMNSNCNHYIRRTDPKHAEACDLAKLALAVWRADATKFEAFDAYVSAGLDAPAVSDARAKAVELVGEQALARELADAQLRDRLAVGVKLYGLAGMGAIPKILVPPNGIIRGRVENRGEVLDFLGDELGLTNLTGEPTTPAGNTSPAANPGDDDLVP